MAKFPTYEQMAKDVAEKALDEILYDGKSIREWMKIIAEQEPCEDCISRAEVLRQTKEWRNNEFLRVTNPYYYLEKRLNDLPPVTPQEPKTDTWSIKDIAKALEKHGFGRLDQEPKTDVPDINDGKIKRDPCEDCISREAAINCVTAASMCDPIITQKRIKMLPSVQPKAEWIPVSEKMPEKDGEYLVTMDGYTYSLKYSDKYGWHYDDGEHFQEFPDVKAWMPLPEPYQEASK